MDLQQALECVNLVPMFKSLPEDQKTESCQTSRSTQISQRHHYYLAGDTVGHFMIVEAGQVKFSVAARRQL